MPDRIRHCDSCGKYMLKETCSCGRKTESRSPPKYSPEDRLAKYRRQEKRKILQEKGLL